MWLAACSQRIRRKTGAESTSNEDVINGTGFSDLTAEGIEDYLANRLQDERKVRTKFGIQLRGKIKPATAHQEFRILSHMLNVAVKQKRLADNPCRGRRVSRIGSKIHSQTSLHDSYRTDQDRVRSTEAPCGTSLSSCRKPGFGTRRNSLPMKKEQVDLDNWVVHIADSETANGIGDMPLTAAAREAFQRQMEEANGREYLSPAPSRTHARPT